MSCLSLSLSLSLENIRCVHAGKYETDKPSGSPTRFAAIPVLAQQHGCSLSARSRFPRPLRTSWMTLSVSKTTYPHNFAAPCTTGLNSAYITYIYILYLCWE